MSALTLEECYANAARFKDRVVVITGAGSGFGRETSVTFAKYGAKLVLGDVDLKGLAGTAALVNDAHGA
jgi:NAD(P)-dependent dehydrogenase (short-subunit alcohol dehydrogenase family)